MDPLRKSTTAMEHNSLLDAVYKKKNYGAIDLTQPERTEFSSIQEESSDQPISIGHFFEHTLQQITTNQLFTNARSSVSSRVTTKLHSSSNTTAILPFELVSTNTTTPVLIHSSANQQGDFSRPITWNRASVEEALTFYEAEAKNITLPRSLRKRYTELASLLTQHLESQEAIKIARRQQHGDEADAYLNVHMCFRDAADQLRRSYIEEVELFQQAAGKYNAAALCFETVAQLAKPHLLTGPLTVTIRNNLGNEKQYNLSEFSFKESGSMREYYKIITDPNIVSGSNLETLQKQKKLSKKPKPILKKHPLHTSCSSKMSLLITQYLII